ncbi:hypothetical protein, partial [Lysobacter capsici]
VPPLKRRVTFFCLKQQKSTWIPFGQKVTKEKCFFMDQVPASAEQTRARVTRNILVPVARDAHPCASPFGCPVANASYKLRSAGSNA